jgi:hypothetical protein
MVPVWSWVLAAQPVLLPTQAAGEVPAPVIAKLDELFAAEVPHVPPTRAKADGPGAAEREARASYERGLEAYRKLDLASSIQELAKAVELAESALAELVDFELLISAHVELAVAELAMKKTEEAEAQLMRALELRPKLELSIDRYPPRAVQAFEKAKKKASAKKRSRLNVSSSPGLATVEVDGIARGDSPISVELPPGRHRYVIEKSDYLAERSVVTIAKAEESVEITLAPDVVPRVRAVIAESVRGNASIEEGIAAATELAAALGASEVLVPAIAADGDGHAVALARVSGGKRTSLTWARIDRDLRSALDAVRALAAGKPGPSIARIDPARSLAGLAPAPAKVAEVEPALPAEEEGSSALWWALGIGAVVLAAAGGTTAYLLSRDEDGAGGDNIVIVFPNPGSN